MLRNLSPTSSSTVLQLIDVVDEDEVGNSSGNRTNLSNRSASTRSTGASYLTSGSTKKGGGNTKKSIKVVKSFDYLTPAVKKAFNHLRHAFTQVLILQHFDPKRPIQIKIDVLGYAIGKVLSQLTLDNLGRWHPVAYYLQKMFSAKTWYKTHNGDLLAIVKAFKTWRH